MKHAKSTNIHAISSHIKAYQKQVYDQNRTSNLKGLLKLLLPHELIYQVFLKSNKNIIRVESKIECFELIQFS